MGEDGNTEASLTDEPTQKNIVCVDFQEATVICLTTTR